METPQSRRLLPLAKRIIAMIAVLFVVMTSTASATVDSSVGVTTQSYTYYSDVPEWAQNSVGKMLSLGYLQGTGVSTNGTLRLDLSNDFARTIVLLDRAGVFGADFAYEIGDNWIEPETAPEVDTESDDSQEDRTLPIYEVYKNGAYVSVPAEIQWIIRDFAQEYGYNERVIFGLALAESTFNPNASNGNCFGLYQIQRFWISGANITHFTDDYASRNLFDPYDATITLIEMWEYARTTYGIDITTDQGMKDLLYWHNCGSYKSNVNWAYSNKIFGFAAELVEIQYN